ncbi:hypothetical protein [Azospirillum sp.]|uniref:hypothetical protein n=1 Tax=Azospirillum sp. TaxID=34012 RepID=UPI003D73677B
MTKSAARRRHATCCHCGEPVLRGQAHWAGDPQDRTWHYHCAESADLVQPYRAWIDSMRSREA